MVKIAPQDENPLDVDAFVKRYELPSREMGATVLKLVDRDGGGTIDPEEYEAWAANTLHGDGPEADGRVVDLFIDLLDSNGDGRVDFGVRDARSSVPSASAPFAAPPVPSVCV